MKEDKGIPKGVWHTFDKPITFLNFAVPSTNTYVRHFSGLACLQTGRIISTSIWTVSLIPVRSSSRNRLQSAA